MQIISGTLKGLTLETTKTQKLDKTLRPTTSYSKQVLFNLLHNNKVIGTEIEGKLILDGFAGTGAVGIEFFSRGASHVTFVDSSPENVKQLKLQTAKFGVSASIIQAFLPDNKKIKTQFDIIFLDPSYEEGKGKIVQTVKNLLNENLAEDGLIVLEILNHKKQIEELKKHLEKKEILLNLIYERESSSKTYFLFFKKIAIVETIPISEAETQE
jgi:16S rRNA (guanine966-N2)-methyltransferase